MQAEFNRQYRPDLRDFSDAFSPGFRLASAARVPAKGRWSASAVLRLSRRPGGLPGQTVNMTKGLIDLLLFVRRGVSKN